MIARRTAVLTAAVSATRCALKFIIQNDPGLLWEGS
jgi:hypothetical protein